MHYAYHVFFLQGIVLWSERTISPSVVLRFLHFCFSHDKYILLNLGGSFTLSEKVVAFKSIAAYRSGLRINPLVSAQDAENGLHKNLCKWHAGLLSLLIPWTLAGLGKSLTSFLFMMSSWTAVGAYTCDKQRSHRFHVCASIGGSHSKGHPHADSHRVCICPQHHLPSEVLLSIPLCPFWTIEVVSCQ